MKKAEEKKREQAARNVFFVVIVWQLYIPRYHHISHLPLPLTTSTFYLYFLPLYSPFLRFLESYKHKHTYTNKILHSNLFGVHFQYNKQTKECSSKN